MYVLHPDDMTQHDAMTLPLFNLVTDQLCCCVDELLLPVVIRALCTDLTIITEHGQKLRELRLFCCSVDSLC